ncbi:MAG TPA: endonuclease/exonuclease/phosphatase family protein [Acidimicrobiales bacterium]|nr:endonuclease/exonuclease/phosphatase family protein [Acidimicrobiales bacterium]
MHDLDPHPPPSFSVATFNAHAGVDGWGRPYDVVAACRAIDADVLVLEENWAPDGGPSLAASVAVALGYELREHALAGGRLAGPHPRADSRWMRPFDWRGRSHAILLDSERPFSPGVVQSWRFSEAPKGRWGLAVLSRLAITGTDVVDLGRLARDRARRAALVVTVDAGVPVTVVGTHMSHLTYGSPVHFVRLARTIGATVGPGPAVVAGDMNLWGPPVGLFFHGWRRAVHAKTWPAWRPHSQVDHVLVRGPLQVLHGEALDAVGSDHRPVRVTLGLGVDP